MKNRKILISTTALVLTAVMVITAVTNQTGQLVYAKDSFDGISSLIEEHSSTADPYTIVELVPDVKMAKLGYLVSGSEPFYYTKSTGTSFTMAKGTFEEVLKNLNDREARQEFIVQSNDRLKAIVTTDDSVVKPLNYTIYAETYDASYGSENSYKELELSEAELLSVGLSGYTMTAAADGDFVLAKLPNTYVPNASGTGSYNQNVLYYAPGKTEGISAAETYYDITFCANSESPELGTYTYEVETAAKIESDMLSSYAGKVVYVLDENGTYRAVTMPDYSQTINPAQTEESTDTDSTEGNGSTGTDETAGDAEAVQSDASQTVEIPDYYLVTFQAVEVEAAMNVTTYTPAAVAFCADGSGAYGAVADASEPYVAVENQNGNFDYVNDGTVSYVEKASTDSELVDSGTYKLVADSSAALDHDVYVTKIWYTGGYTNNDFFKKEVFNQSGLLDEDNTDIAIKVVVLTPEQLNNYNLYTVDMLYISNSSMYVSDTDSLSSYMTGNDLNSVTAQNIWNLVASSDSSLPVVVDYSILQLANEIADENANENVDETTDGEANTGESATDNELNIYKLVRLLNNESVAMDENLITDASMEWDITNLAGDQFNDDDHYYVNRNILMVPGESGDFKLFEKLSEVIVPDSVVEGTQVRTYTETEFKTMAEAAGFGQIADTIISENFYRQIENNADTGTTYSYFDQYITGAIAFEYIISDYAKSSEVESDATVLNILDIEPCTLTAATAQKIEEKLAGYFGAGDSCTLNVTHMSTSELNGKVEDLNNYDAIYMGLETDYMNTASFSTPVSNTKETRVNYNDDTMDGLVYTNIGDIQYDATKRGLFDTDYARSDLAPYENYWKQITTFWGRTAQNDLQNISSNTTYDLSSRYSGNDITDEVRQELITFVKSGAPVILADNFITKDSTTQEEHVFDYYYKGGKRITGTNSSSKVYNGYIDNCSYMYELIKEIKVGETLYANVFMENSITDRSSQLLRYATLGKPVLKVTTADTKDTNYVETTNGNIVMNIKVSNPGSANANAKFNCLFYIDYNADGRYSDTTELISASNYNISADGKNLSSGSKAQVTLADSGVQTECYQLSPGVNYQLKYAVPSGYVGLLPVKVVVTQSSNLNRYDSDIEYFYKSGDGTKKTIKALQILPTKINVQSKSAGYTLFDLDLTGSYEDGNAIDPNKYKDKNSTQFYNESKVANPSAWNESVTKNDSTANKKNWNNLISNFASSDFYKYALGDDALSDYELKVDSIYADHLYEYLEDPEHSQLASDFNIDAYDMLIIGFGDSYSLFNGTTYTQTEIKTATEKIMEVITQFVNEGKSLLFTHDTTDYTNYYDNSSWGYYLSMALAPVVGMDRYGIYGSGTKELQAVLQAGIDKLSAESDTTYKTEDYYSLKTWSSPLTEQKYSSADLFNYVVNQDSSSGEKKDVAYWPNSDKKTLTKSVQGRTYWTVDANADYTYTTLAKYSGESENKGSYTTLAELNNDGQILRYPYNILNEMSTDENGDKYLNIAETHGQYFQLDLAEDANGDGESDITVWLTLADISKADWTSVSKEPYCYSYSENDARENYYIYTKGNITYSGVGHTDINDGNHTAELKLYINTIITAYNAGIQAPDVSIKQTEDSNSADLNIVYVGVDYLISDDGEVEPGDEIDKTDDTDDTDDANDYETVYFTVDDSNYVANNTKTIEADYFLLYDNRDDISDHVVDDAVVEFTSESAELYGVDLAQLVTGFVTYDSDEEEATTLISGNVYHINVPYKLLGDTEDCRKIRVRATTTFTAEDGSVSRTTGYKDFYIQRVGLFDLE